MDTNSINNEVINIQSTLPSFDSYENYYQESIFRSLSTNFDNTANISIVNEAYSSLEKCFVQNNILNKQGVCKFKASSSSKLLLDYRDIEDAFADIGFSESVSKIAYDKQSVKKIDFKQFDVCPFNFCDFTNSDNDDSHSNTEDNEDSETFVGSLVSENEISEHEASEDELTLISTDNDSLVNINRNESKKSSDHTQSNNFDTLLKSAVRDVRVVVQKLPEDADETYDNSYVYNTESSGKGRRQVARKKTGGVVNICNNDDDLHSQEQRVLDQLSSKDGDFVPSVFDKMTRGAKRDLERVLAESTANLVIEKTGQLISEKIKELRSSDQSDDSSSDDEPAESDIQKTAEIVTNTIIEFLTKNKYKKLEKLGKDISSEISNKLNSLKFNNEIVSNNILPDLIQTQTLSNGTIPAVDTKPNSEIVDARSNSVSHQEENNADSSQNTESLEKSHKNENKIRGSLENTADLLENDTENDAPRRPITRLSQLRNEVTAKTALESVVPKVTIKRTMRSRGRVFTTLKKTRNRSRQSNKVSSAADKTNSLIDGQFLIDSEINEESTSTLDEVFNNKELTPNVSTNLAGEEILKATADSTTPEIISNNNETTIDEINVRETKSKDNTNISLETSSVSAVGNAKAKSSFEEESGCHSSQDNDEAQFTSLIDNLELPSQSNFDLSATASPKMENDIKENITFNKDQYCDERKENKDSINLNEISEVVSVASSSVLSELLNDIITSIEKDIKDGSNITSSEKIITSTDQDIKDRSHKTSSEKIITNIEQDIKGGSHKTSSEKIITNIEQDIKDGSNKTSSEKIITGIDQDIKDGSNKTSSEKICEMEAHEVPETLSTSFLDYTLDDSCRLVVDESFFKTDSQLPEDSAEGNIDAESTEQNDQSNSELIALEPLNTEVKTQAESKAHNIEDLNLCEDLRKQEENVKQDIGFKDSEISKDKTDANSKIGNALIKKLLSAAKRKEHASKKNVNEKPASAAEQKTDDSFKLKENLCEKQKTGVCSMIEKNVIENLGSIALQKSDDSSKVNIKKVEKLELAAKQLTNEEKIARLTNRDPRLVNDKKMANVMLRDPRIRKKIPKVEEANPQLNQPETCVHTDPKKELENVERKPEPKSDIPTKPVANADEISCEKSSSQHSVKPSEVADNNDLNRKKKKKDVDEELLYKTPLSDLHESISDRPKYERNIKQKRVANPLRKDRDLTESNKIIAPRRIPSLLEIKNPSGYSESHEEEKPDRYYHHDLSVNNRTSRFPKNNELTRRSEDPPYGGNYEKKDVQPVRQQDYQSSSRQSIEQEGYARRIPTTERKEFSDNQFFTRREFYRRNRYTHDHDHIGSSRSYPELREEKPYFSRQDHLVNSDSSAYRVSTHHKVPLLPDPVKMPLLPDPMKVPLLPDPVKVPLLPDPVYESRENFDPYSSPSSDIYSAPPPPMIRSPTPEQLIRESNCPSPPRIGRDSPDDEDYEEFNRAFHRDYERDERCFRGRNKFTRDKREHRPRNRSNGKGHRDYLRNDESPPRKRFVTERYYDPDDDYRGRRSPSWSPERTRHYSRDRSISPDLSWDRSPEPWDSPPSPESHHNDNFRDRTKSRSYRYNSKSSKRY